MGLDREPKKGVNFPEWHMVRLHNLGSGRTCFVEHIICPSLGYLFEGISVVVGDRASTVKAPPIHIDRIPPI